jgi:hypothetical protein
LILVTIEKAPPSDKDQQFKDGVIWAECIRLLDTDDVYLVTTDKAFYKSRQHENGLAEALAIEAKNSKHAIHIFPTLSALLEIIRTEVKLDENSLVSQFWKSARESIEGILERNSFAVAGAPTVTTRLYVTEDPNRLYAEFSIAYRCEDLTADTRTDAILVLNGDCTYLVKERECEAFRNYGEELIFKTKDGEEKNQRNAFIYVDGLIIGHKTVEHSIKYKIEDSSN